MKKKAYAILILMPVLLFATAMLNFAQAQEADQLSTTAVEARGDGDTEEIKDHDFLNELDAIFEAPAYKSGGDEGERASSRYVKFDNYTNWYVRCYVDGVLQGTMAPWGSLTIYLPRSETYRFYAVAPFRDAADKTWGGINRYVSGGFTWSLYP